ncbi:MAG TPA: DNA-binding response regulator [Legionella sp.]|nr:DNA-binding response regulator [Legionella sp.]
MTELNNTVFLVEDDVSVRNSLQWLLESVQLIVKSYASGQAFLKDRSINTRGCLITDVRMPGMSGLELIDELNAAGYVLPIIVITGHGDIAMAVRAMKFGAIDFITKPFDDQYLIDQVHQALKKNSPPPAFMTAQTTLSLEFARLTPREHHVMLLIIDGKLNKQIANELNIGLSTVELHRARIMKKTNANSIAELVKKWMMLTSGLALEGRRLLGACQ